MSTTPPPTPSPSIIDAAVRSALPGPRPPQPGTRKGREIALVLTPASATDCPDGTLPEARQPPGRGQTP
jgi:hypothetical protein